MADLTLQTMSLSRSLPIVRCPEAVRVASKSGAELNDNMLLPEEASATANFSKKRLDEFTLGRVCAREVLATMGYAGFPVRVGDARQPVWPENLVGSISHTGDIAICAIARAQDIVGIGIDIELISPDSFDLLGIVASAKEHATLSPSLKHSSYMAKLLFSAKESVFKCQFPLTGKWLEFKDVTLTLDHESRQFETEIEVPGRTLGISGTWDMTAQYILTIGWIA